MNKKLLRLMEGKNHDRKPRYTRKGWNEAIESAARVCEARIAEDCLSSYADFYNAEDKACAAAIRALKQP